MFKFSLLFPRPVSTKGSFYIDKYQISLDNQQNQANFEKVSGIPVVSTINFPHFKPIKFKICRNSKNLSIISQFQLVELVDENSVLIKACPQAASRPAFVSVWPRKYKNTWCYQDNIYLVFLYCLGSDQLQKLLRISRRPILNINRHL